MSNIAEIYEKIATLVADLFTEELFKAFRHATELELGYTRDELFSLQVNLKHIIVYELRQPSERELQEGIVPPYIREYMNTRLRTSDSLFRAIRWSGNADGAKWKTLLPHLHILIKDNRIFSIDNNGVETCIDGQPEESAEVAEDLDTAVAKWSNQGGENKASPKLHQAEPNLTLPRYRYNYYGAFLEIPASEVVFDRVTDLKYGLKFSLTPKGYVYTVVSVDHIGPGSWMRVTVVAKKWRKVMKSIQKVGKSNRTTKEIIVFDEPTKKRILYLAKDRRIYSR